MADEEIGMTLLLQKIVDLNMASLVVEENEAATKAECHEIQAQLDLIPKSATDYIQPRLKIQESPTSYQAEMIVT